MANGELRRALSLSHAAGTMSFDRLAPFYRGLERGLAGSCLHRGRVMHLAALPVPRRALLLGEGHGRFLPELLRRFPEVEVTVVEGSAGMIAAARVAVEEAGYSLERVKFVHADLRSWSPGNNDRFDLLAALYVFDSFTASELESLIARVGAAAAGGAYWLVADFRIPPAAGFARWRAWAIVTVLYRFFRWTVRLHAQELVSPDPFLERAGFALNGREVFEWGMLYSDLWIRRGEHL